MMVEAGSIAPRLRSLENVSDALPQRCWHGTAGHFYRLRARRSLAGDAIAKRICFPRVRRHCLLRILEQVFDGLVVRRRQIRNCQLAPALEMSATETGKAPNLFDLQAIHAFPLF